MLDRLLKTIRANEPPANASTAQLWRKHIAVAAMLVEASRIDRRMTDEESTAIVRALMRRFGMSEADASQLVAAAQAQFADSLDDWVYTEAVRTGYGYEQRIEIVGLLWEVVYADGALSKLEADLIERLAQQLDIAPDDLTAARIEAFGRVSGGRRDADGARTD